MILILHMSSFRSGSCIKLESVNMCVLWDDQNHFSGYGWTSSHPLSAKTLHSNGLVQEKRNSIANELELCLPCTNPSICNIFCWLRPCTTIDRKKGPWPFQPSALVCHIQPQTNVSHAQVIAHMAQCQAVHNHNHCTETSTAIINFHIVGLVQERCNSSALAMELHLSCINPPVRQQWSYIFLALTHRYMLRK